MFVSTFAARTTPSDPHPGRPGPRSCSRFQEAVELLGISRALGYQLVARVEHLPQARMVDSHAPRAVLLALPAGVCCRPERAERAMDRQTRALIGE